MSLSRPSGCSGSEFPGVLERTPTLDNGGQQEEGSRPEVFRFDLLASLGKHCASCAPREDRYVGYWCKLSCARTIIPKCVVQKWKKLRRVNSRQVLESRDIELLLEVQETWSLTSRSSKGWSKG
ncbi:hypothetical protein KM043_002418 [Ampulex compressa]|nr:hypothetical protein KM043_002418 [Ampulex compressa]